MKILKLMNKKYAFHKAAILALSTAFSLMPFFAGAQNPLPTVNSIFPLSVNAGSPAITVIINGTNFVSNSVVNFNGVAKPTAYISAVQLSVSLSASDLAFAGSYSITVTNPAPGGGTSNSQIFTVTGGSVVPTINSISPSSKLFGGADFILTISGNNFNANSLINFNGLPKATTYVSANQLTANIPAADIANIGTYLITVFDPVRGSSNSLPFIVTSTPTIPNTGFVPITNNGAGPNGGLTGTILTILAISILCLLIGTSVIKLMKFVLAK